MSAFFSQLPLFQLRYVVLLRIPLKINQPIHSSGNTYNIKVIGIEDEEDTENHTKHCVVERKSP